MRIEDYALVGDTHTAALVGRGGSIDWLCLPRFDSGACFAALLGGPENGRWRLAPTQEPVEVHRRYRPDTLVLETEHTTQDGRVRVVDCMPVRDAEPTLVRRVECLEGRVTMRSELGLRLDYGHVVPWLRRRGERTEAFTGPDRLILDGDVEHEGDPDLIAEFEVAGGETVDFRLAWTRPRDPAPPRSDVGRTIEETTQWWRDWAARCTYEGPYAEQVRRSLITIKALTYHPSGGIVAAPTTSLPEQLGGERNWDYRYCWIRDATFTLLGLLDAGYTEEASAWREWLLRAVAGRADQMQIMYGLDGERRLPEVTLDWLSGYADSRPVRSGNAASGQFQLDIYGELMDALHQARTHGVPPEAHAWDIQRGLLEFVEEHWHEPDSGIWEMRGPARHFTYSKVMAWAALDRGVEAVEQFGLDGPVERWKQTRHEIFEEVCREGFDTARNTFTQYYGSDEIDAALLLLSEVGFLPADDPRIVGTVEAVEKELCRDGLVLRYSEDSRDVDGLSPGEGAFLACSFWLANVYVAQGRLDEARELFERMLRRTNDLGLLSEEYDAAAGRLVGNFPQALSHVALVNSALDLAAAAEGRRRGRSKDVNRPDAQGA
jgi:pentatricopeptide repeat protein